MTPKTADSLALQYFANREDQEKSIETYYHKIKTPLMQLRHLNSIKPKPIY